MTALTQDFLHGIGVTMDEATFEAFSEHFDDTLHERVIEHVIHTLDEEQLRQLAELRQLDSEQVWQWLQTNVPDLGDIIRQEVDTSLTEVVQSGDRL